MASRRLLVLAASLGFGPACAMGCSFINTFDDVKPQVADDAGGDATTDHASPVEDSGTDTSQPTTDASDAGADTADAAPLEPAGAIVIGASVNGADGGDDTLVLSVVDPKDGKELGTRETMKVAGVQYDGIRDLWYIFESKGAQPDFHAGPTDEVDFHVRTLDTHTGAWTEKAKIVVPPLVAPEDVVVLRDRVVYVAYSVLDGGGLGYQLVVLDTSKSDAPTVASKGTSVSSPNGMVGTRAAAGSAGGTVDFFLVDKTACIGDGGQSAICQLNMTPISIPPSSAPVINTTNVTPVGAVAGGGSAGVGSYLGGGPDTLVAFPPVNGQPAYIEHFAATGGSLGQKVTFPSAGGGLKALAVSECYNLAFTVELKTQAEIFGIPVSGGQTTVLEKGLGHSGQQVAFEPFTNSAIAPFKADTSGELTAFAVTGPIASPTLTKRQAPGWAPPTDLKPNLLATRQPIPFTCP